MFKKLEASQENFWSFGSMTKTINWLLKQMIFSRHPLIDNINNK